MIMIEMEEMGIFTGIVVAILGVAYPILFQVIARLDEKYYSDHIVELFDKEYEKNCFVIVLVVSLLASLLWSLGFEPLFQMDGFNFFINNSAAILVIVSTITLVIFFFLFIRKILIYYTPTKFIKYLIRKNNFNDSDLQYFNALGDIYLQAIKKQNQNITQTITNFFYECFQNERNNFIDKPVEYPDDLYFLVYKSIEELALIKDKRNYAAELHTAGGLWLFGGLQGYSISDKTYRWLWENINLSIKHEKDDLILFHWQTAHQYLLQMQMSLSSGFSKSTDDMRKMHQKEMDRFLEFHFALGGLLMYKRRYECISRIFTYTTSQPPNYVLLPSNMDEIFKFYYKIRDSEDFKSYLLADRYQFPEMDGIKSDDLIFRWIAAYLSVLFLRQYSASYFYYSGNEPLKPPLLPKTQSEIKSWIAGIVFFKVLVKESLRDKILVDSLKLNFLTKKWCTKSKKEYPTVYLKNLKSSLQERYHDNSINLPLANEKVEKFYTSTRRNVETTLSLYSTINNDSEIVDNFSEWFIGGQKILQDRDAFLETSEIDHIGFDSFFSFNLCKDIEQGIASTFIYNKKRSYVLKQEDMFKAIDKLTLSNDYYLITFGMDLNYYINNLEQNNLAINKYKHNEIVSLPENRIVNSSMFILKKEDLPIISSLPIDKKLIEKYSLKDKNRLGSKFHIYAMVLDLSTSSEIIKSEYLNYKEEDELKKSVVLDIMLNVKIRWKKGVDLIHIMEYSEYTNKGLPDSLNDVGKL